MSVNVYRCPIHNLAGWSATMIFMCSSGECVHVFMCARRIHQCGVIRRVAVTWGLSPFLLV